jgi:hypothetical protein
MGTRTLGIVAALGLLASFSAYAEQPIGDIVDQILKTLPPAAGRPVPPPPMASPPPTAPIALTPAAANPSPPGPSWRPLSRRRLSR